MAHSGDFPHSAQVPHPGILFLGLGGLYRAVAVFHLLGLLAVAQPGLHFLGVGDL